MPKKKKSEDSKEENKEEIKEAKKTEEVSVKENKEKPKLEKLDVSSLKKDDKKISEIVEKLAKEGMPKSRIGLVLRDSYGIPKSKLIGKKIGISLREKGITLKIPEDLSDLLKKSDNLRRHLDKNKQDKSAKRGLQLTEAKIKKLSHYYKKRNLLPEGWKR